MEGEITVNVHEGNPGEIDFGLSYRESSVLISKNFTKRDLKFLMGFHFIHYYE